MMIVLDYRAGGAAQSRVMLTAAARVDREGRLFAHFLRDERALAVHRKKHTHTYTHTKTQASEARTSAGDDHLLLQEHKREFVL